MSTQELNAKEQRILKGVFEAEDELFAQKKAIAALMLLSGEGTDASEMLSLALNAIVDVLWETNAKIAERLYGPGYANGRTG